MRKSNLAKYEREKKRQERLKKGIAFFIIGVMLIGTAAFVFSLNPTGTIGRQSTTIEEFGLTFNPTIIENTQLWRTEINGVEEFFYLLPSQIGYFDINQTLLEEMKQEQILILGLNTSDGNASFLSAAASQISATLGNLQIQMGIASTDVNNELNMTYLDCQNATIPGLTFTLSEETLGLNTDGGCYEISAFNGQELLLVTEFIRYELLGAQLGN